MRADPYRYFRIEARELTDELAAGVAELHRKGVDPQVVARLLRHTHTLKGAARVVGQEEMAGHAHELEDLLTPARDGAPIGREAADAMRRHVDAMQAALHALDLPAPITSEHASEPPRSDTSALISVEMGQIDEILGGLDQVRMGIEAVRVGLGDALRQGGSPALRRIAATVQRAARDLDDTRKSAGSLRLLPASTIFTTIEAAIHDAAGLGGVEVELHTSGGEVEVDGHVLREVRDALLHVVRNAVAHGIEPVGERAARGKPRKGRIDLRVEQARARVVFSVRDDGRGIDRGALLREAERRGLPIAADTERTLASLLFAGVTTARSLTQLSGRGVGLDVVRSVVQRLGGDVDVRSVPGGGTEFDLALPARLTALRALAVHVASGDVLIPLSSVVTSLRLVDAPPHPGSGGAAIRYSGRDVPYAPLAAVLAGDPGEARLAAVVSDGENLAAIGVERITSIIDILLRPLPAVAGRTPLVSGVSLDIEGRPLLVLSPRDLVAAVRAARPIAEVESVRERLPVLVIDDSLTSRMLQQSILENAGYEVDTAPSAEDGLALARTRRYGVMVVDVEMPGMNGFEFVTLTRADPTLSTVPAILVTSLGSAEHRRRGMESGASAYIVKGEFDESRLLGTIAELTR